MKQRLVLIIFAGATLIAPAATHAAQASSNDMVRGGVASTGELVSKLDDTTKSCSGGSYSTTLLDEYQGVNKNVTAQSLKSSDLRNGYVTKSGNVVVDGKVVATGAKSYGRCDISGSKHIGHLYERPTSVSFNQERLDAYVYMPNGRYSYAIIKSCGNIVTATAKAPVQKAVAKTTAPVVIVNQTQSQVQTVAAPAPAPAPVLPQTGAGLVTLLGTTAIGTVGWYYLRSRKQLRDSQINLG